MEVRIPHGRLAGARVDQGVVFRGIPFAAPPFGPNRFKPPQPPDSWDGVRDATCSGCGVPQPTNDPIESRWRFFNPIEQGPDCLNLNVWTPDPATSGLPVMVWIHGGGFMSGGGSVPAHDGTTFCRDGVVYVSINYRMHADGFLYLGGDTANLGLQDQVAALRWVQDNIADFGGDPANVTVFGQSAGAVSVMCLLAMPSARGLFRRAIAHSGCPLALGSIGFNERVAKRLGEVLGVQPSAEGIGNVPTERLLAAVQGLALEYISPAMWGSDSFLVSAFRPVADDEVLPADITTSMDASVDYMAGTTSDETTFVMQPFGLLHDVPEWWTSQALETFGIDRNALTAYRKQSRPDAGEAELFQAAWTDWAFRIPTLRSLEAHRGRAFAYEFGWKTRTQPAMGATHALDLAFTFDSLDAFSAAMPPNEDPLGAEPPQALADAMHRACMRFAATGDPGWAPYARRRTTMRFDEHSEPIEDLAGAEREMWAGIR